MYPFRNCSTVMSAAILALCTATVPLVANAKNDVTPINVTLSDPEKAMIDWVDQNQQSILDELKLHVDMNTGTGNI